MSILKRYNNGSDTTIRPDVDALKIDVATLKAGGGGGSASIPVSTRPTVSVLDAYFEGTCSQAYFIPMLLFDCSSITGFASGGTFTFSFTPDFSNSPTQFLRVDDWYNTNNSDTLSGGTLATFANADNNITTGTRITFTRSITPFAGNTYFGILPKFVPVGAATNASYKLKMSNIVVTFKGVAIPLNLLINVGGHLTYTPNMTLTELTKSQDYVPNKLQSRFAGRTYCAYGDSITATSSGNPGTTNLYPAILTSKLGMFHYTNRATSGQTLSNSNATNTVLTYVKMHQDFDLITIALGVNDYLRNVPLGSIGINSDATASFDQSTFYGALRFVLDSIFTANPYTTVVLFTPITKTSEAANTLGLVLDDYRNAIVNVGKMYNLPVCHMEMCLNQMNVATFLFDGLHPNDEGHRKYADYVASYLCNV
jgi:lysophospholipase L1-like esterase